MSESRNNNVVFSPEKDGGSAPQLKNLFLRQSYLDAYSDYERSLENESAVVWDYVVLSASNQTQAEAYRQQIVSRQEKGKLCRRTHYLVVSDPEGKRVGSGGATLNIIKTIALHSKQTDFSGLRILVLHSGGDAKRTPQYSACGKIFSPVPRMLPDGRRSTLFDEFLINLSGIPARLPGGGMLVCSGDVLLLFNALQLDFSGEGAVALSMKEPVETGKNHGVFLGDNAGNVRCFLHKQTPEKLRLLGAVDEDGRVDLDTGAVIFSGAMLNDLYCLIDTDRKFDELVNDRVRLSFYADFLYPLASDSTLSEFYREQPEGEYSSELSDARTLLWEVLRKYRLKMIRFSPASFLHFGTTGELLKLMTEDMPAFRFLDWSALVNTNLKPVSYAVSNSYISQNAEIGKNCYIEDSYVHHNTKIGEGCVISCVTLRGVTVPDGTVLHGLKLADGRFVVRMYAVSDNPKFPVWFGEPMDEPLWTKPLFIACDTMDEAVQKTLNRETAPGMLSLAESFALADVNAILPWQQKLNDTVKAEAFLAEIDRRVPAEQAISVFRTGISERVVRYLMEEATRLDENCLSSFSRKIRIYYYLSKVTDREKMTDRCFQAICRSVLNAAPHAVGCDKMLRIVKDDVVVRLPVRVNWGGGWSDTPPYCSEHGGTVLNAAVTLDGNLPIEVSLKKTEEKKIILSSTDIGSYREFDDLSLMQDCRNPSDPFALHKAALIACGVIPAKAGEESVVSLCRRLGGGIYMNTRVINIPKGSGLGTSSLLSAACVKGLYAFTGREVTQNEVYSRVMCMEQIMSTGGGWQDQVGGLSAGIKMVSSAPGLRQDIFTEPVRISPETLQELKNRFALIYTGQRRLARNLLREVVGKYIGGEPSAVQVLNEIQRLAVLMRFELEKGNVDGFAGLLSEHWECSKRLDAGCTNTCIDQIFHSVEDLIDGRMICGAGGGGFLQVILKKNVCVADLQKRLREVFADSGVCVWKAEILTDSSVMF